MGRSQGVRLLLVGFVLLVGLGIALATGAVRAGKPAPAPTTPPPPLLGTAKGGVFSGSGVTFHYPPTWRTLPQPASPVQGPGPLGRIVLGSGTGTDRVLVEAFRLATPITDSTKTVFLAQVSQEVSAFASAENGSLRSKVTATTLGSLPAYTARAEWPGPGGVTMTGRFYFAYQGYAVYEVSCQRATTASAEIDAGCRQIVTTFRTA